MSEVLIMAYPHVEWDDDGESFKVATVFGDIPLICLMTVPKEAFDYIEEQMEAILEHETLELILAKMGLVGELDNIFPYTHSLTEVIE